MGKKKKALYAAVVVLGVVVLGLAAGVFAKYISEVSGTGTAKVAKWAFVSDNASTELDCDLTGNYIDGTLADDGNGGKVIAPGTQGVCKLELSNKNSEVAVDYVITLSGISAPQNMVFSQTDGGTTTTFAAGDTIEGHLAIGETKTVNIDWNWAYSTDQTNDGEDTADGMKADDARNMNVTFTVTGTQTKPTSN